MLQLQAKFYFILLDIAVLVQIQQAAIIFLQLKFIIFSNIGLNLNCFVIHVLKWGGVFSPKNALYFVVCRWQIDKRRGRFFYGRKTLEDPVSLFWALLCFGDKIQSVLSAAYIPSVRYTSALLFVDLVYDESLHIFYVIFIDKTSDVDLSALDLLKQLCYKCIDNVVDCQHHLSQADPFTHSQLHIFECLLHLLIQFFNIDLETILQHSAHRRYSHIHILINRPKYFSQNCGVHSQANCAWIYRKLRSVCFCREFTKQKGWIISERLPAADERLNECQFC